MTSAFAQHAFQVRAIRPGPVVIFGRQNPDIRVQGPFRAGRLKSHSVSKFLVGTKGKVMKAQVGDKLILESHQLDMARRVATIERLERHDGTPPHWG